MANSRLAHICAWKVISDPLEVGAFEADTRFSTQEVVFMLKYHTFTLGSVMQHRDYGKFTVKDVMGNRLPYLLKNGKYVATVRNQNLRITTI